MVSGNRIVSEVEMSAPAGDRQAELKARIADLEAQGRLRDTLPLLRERAALAREEDGADSPAYVAALNELGSLCRTLKELDESEAEFVKAARIEASARGTENPDYATCINNLAGTYRLKGDHQKAEALSEEALEIYKRVLGTEHFVYLSALNNLGLVYQDLKRYEAAEALHRQALDVLEKRGKRDTVLATTLNNLAAVAMATGRYDEAERFLVETLSLYEQTPGKDSVLYLTGMNNLATVDYLKGDYGRAEERFGAYEDRIAAGLVGEGSHCYGFDDELSRDHDWGPRLLPVVDGE